MATVVYPMSNGGAHAKLLRPTCHILRMPPQPFSMGLIASRKRAWLAVQASKDKQQDDDDSLERLLWKELEKRGISGPDDLQGSGPPPRSRPDPAPQFQQEKLRSQLEESRKLNSEGLEGLIPRGKQLVSLGGTFFLAFWPFLLVLSAVFSGIFWLYGENFIHGGRPSYTRYIEPAELLSEPTIDERIPFK